MLTFPVDRLRFVDQLENRFVDLVDLENKQSQQVSQQKKLGANRCNTVLVDLVDLFLIRNVKEKE